MFSPVGKQKLLLQIKRAKEMGVKDPLARVLAAAEAASPVGKSPTKRSRSGASPDGSTSVGGGGETVMSTAKLEKLLADKGVKGIVMQRILESTVRYNPATDTTTLRAFQSRNINYDLFRHYLHSCFWLTFNDVEFNELLNIFDPNSAELIDGYQFMIAFIHLGGIRKQKHAEAKRKENEDFLKNQALEEERKKRELEKKNEIAADFNFDDGVKEIAMRKLAAAAKKFDPSTGPTLEAFNGKYMTAALLREMLKRVFNLRVSGKELGAILKSFEESDKAEKKARGELDGASIEGGGDKQPSSTSTTAAGATTATGGAGAATSSSATVGLASEIAKAAQVQISCSDFLRHFLRLGFEGRDREKAEQRRKQQMLDRMAEEERVRKLTESENKLSMQIDYDFSAVDEARALEKLKEASTKYDRNAPGCQSLDGFECESLSPGAFRDLVRRVFGLVLSNKELGFVIRKYDKLGTGRVTCKSFLTSFLKIGIDERHKHHLAQLDKQRRMDELAAVEAEQKIREVQQGSTKLKINYDFQETDLEAAKRKLTHASMFFDPARGGSLTSFEPLDLTPIEFKRALKRTFNLTFTPTELGALVCTYDKEGKGRIHCQNFVNAFFAMGHEERDKARLNQLRKNVQGEKALKAAEEKKRHDLMNKTDIDVDFDFTEEDRDSGLEKMLISATKYDKSHPAAMSLDGFDCLSMSAAAWKELVRRTFNLKLKPKEVGALIRHFDKSEGNLGMEIDCGEFLTIFLQLGYAERAKHHKEQLEKQRREDKERAEEEAAKLLATTQRAGAKFQIDMVFTEKDIDSAVTKLVTASEKYDKNHPAAPDLSAFDISTMSAGLFREQMKSCFGIRLEPRELGFCVATYGNKDTQQINSIDFLTKFLIMGKQSRYEKHRKFLVKQRQAIKEAKKEAEDKLTAQFEKAELNVDLNDWREQDLDSAMAKIKTAASKYDKTHPAAPSTAGFTGGAMKPGEFRELVRRTFNLWLNPKELAAVVNYFSFDAEKKSGKIDSKAFLIRFIKLGFEARGEFKASVLEKQRLAEVEMAQERARKKRLAEQKMVTDIDNDYGEVDRSNCYAKLTASSAKYDKNAPGCPSLAAFDAAHLTPMEFREVMKRTFNISLAPRELAVLVDDFDNGGGNVDCQSFIIHFIKLGAEERSKFKLIMLEKQRKDDLIRKTEHERKMREAEEKMVLNVSYSYTEEEKNAAFIKMAAAAKKYDKNAPGCMSLDGFEQKSLSPAVFREMVRRTFGLVLTGPELGAVMNFFDKKGKGAVPSHDFIIYFLKIGQVEREKDHMASLQVLRKDAEERKRMEEETLAAQWAKTELKVSGTFSAKDHQEALRKLEHAAFKFDPASPGPMGLTAFQAQYLSPGVFREMLKRSFNLKVTDAELAALISEFESPHAEKAVDCQRFMVRFTQLGADARSRVRVRQVEKNRKGVIAIREEHALKKKAADDKMAGVAEYDFGKSDFNAALDKIRAVAGNYDRGHPSSPSLSGFQGANMLPHEFKTMMMRTFQVALTGKELGALTKFFDSSAGSNTIDSQEFLAHFFKLQRQEQDKRRKELIEKERLMKRRKEEEEEALDRVKQEEEASKCKYSKADEESFMRKLRASAQDYAYDSAALQESLQAFKGPALSAQAFREIFGRIFHRNKFSFPEMGVLLSILDQSGSGTLDGPRFLNWFYKLGRREALIMLGEAEDDITLSSLRSQASAAFAAAEAAAHGGEIPMEPFNSPSAAASKGGNSKGNSKGKANSASSSSSAAAHRRSSSAAEEGGAGEADGVTKATLEKNWLLPQTTETQTPPLRSGSLEDAFSPISVKGASASASATATASASATASATASAAASAERDGLIGEMNQYKATVGAEAVRLPGMRGSGSGSQSEKSLLPTTTSPPPKVVIVRDEASTHSSLGTKALGMKGTRGPGKAAAPGGFFFPSLLAGSPANVAPSGMSLDLF